MPLRPKISIIVLTYNRLPSITRNLLELSRISYDNLEIIVVDNSSEVNVEENFNGNTKNIKFIRNNKNMGVAGRNIGMAEASGEIIVTLDDDVFGFDDSAIECLITNFESDESIGAVNFKIIDDKNERQVNWIHHKKLNEWADKTFNTYEISEGAVAFKRVVLKKSGLYPEYFFISHEGPDLALRIMALDYNLIYCPNITVRHAHAPEGRPNWRRYYFDTRNLIWLAIRRYPLMMAMRKLLVGLGAQLIYAVRDGFLKWWFLGIIDGLKKFPVVSNDRDPMNNVALEKYRRIEKSNPSVFYMLRKRLFSKNIRI